MSTQTTPMRMHELRTGRAPYQAPRLSVHGTVAAMTQAQPSRPAAVISSIVDAEVTFLGPNA